MKTGFAYVDAQSQKPIKSLSTLERIKALKVPPAYADVLIDKDKSAKVQAYGFDGKGRKQTIYHPDFVRRKADEKFERVTRLSDKMDSFLKVLYKDIDTAPSNSLKLGTAIIVGLVLHCNFRLGSEKYLAQNNTYGLTTLEVGHLRIDKSSKHVTIKFNGKHNKENLSECTDAAINRYLRKQKRGKGRHDRVFTYDKGSVINASHVNEYIHSINPEVTSKDLRTWNANKLFLEFMEREDVKQSKNPAAAAIKLVALELHNTHAVCRSNYIDPTIVEG
jgi:DNA topoisomerase-1